MHNSIPVKLNADSIIDAVIEIRVESTQSLASVMPGVLLQANDVGFRQLHRLPTADIPEPIRQKDPNLMHQPTLRIELEGGFNLLVGDHVLAIVSPKPYVSGSIFKEKALQVIRNLLKLSIVKGIGKLSIKYIDFIEGNSLEKLRSYLSFDYKLGEISESETLGYDLSFNTKCDDVISLIKLVAPIRINNGKEGLIIDVDTIKLFEKMTVDDLDPLLPELLDEIHKMSKKQFFSLLTDSALEKLEAVYE